MKCKYCGNHFKFKPKKMFCSPSCRLKFQKAKNIRHCIVCGKEFQNKQGGKKYCSKECKNAKWNEKRRLDYAMAKKKQQAHMAIGENAYDKQYNPNIEICLNCKNEDCEGTCEKINTLIKG